MSNVNPSVTWVLLEDVDRCVMLKNDVYFRSISICVFHESN